MVTWRSCGKWKVESEKVEEGERRRERKREGGVFEIEKVPAKFGGQWLGHVPEAKCSALGEFREESKP